MEPIGQLDEHTDLLMDVEAAGHSRGHDAALADGVLAEITHLLVSEGSPAKVLEAVADAIKELIPYDTLTLYQADEPLRLLRRVLVRERWAQEILAMPPLRYGEGVAGNVAETRRPQLVNDVLTDPRAIQIDGTPEEPEALICVPLLAREGLKGILSLYRLGQGNLFDDREFDLAIRFGELAALAIDNAQIRARLETEVVTDHLTALFNHRYFHERLAEEVRRANRRRTGVGLLIYDIDDFKRVNDAYGHLVGDQILQGVASISRETCRAEDIVCRIGGEEFAVILPGSNMKEAVALAERIRESVAGAPFPMIDQVTVSVGVAEGPLHASSSRELMTCADLAMLRAKAEGKNRVCLYSGGGDGRSSQQKAAARKPRRSKAGYGAGMQARLTTMAARGEARHEAHLRTLQNLSNKLNRLTDVGAIGEAITAELRSLIDYHNCRVFLLQPDGETLVPVAFRGNVSEYEGEIFDALVTQVGAGVTGHVVETGESHYAPDANNDPYAVDIPGTYDMDESMLAVPLRYGDRVTGAVVLSKLGIDQFDREDMRLLEALASTAAVAFENAALFQKEREAAETSVAMLRLSQAMTRPLDTEGVVRTALDAIPSLVPCSGVGAWIRDRATGSFRLVAHRGFDPKFSDVLTNHEVPAETAEQFLVSVEEPFVMRREILAAVPRDLVVMDELRDVLVAPVRWEPEGLGAIVFTAAEEGGTFSERDLRLARGIADLASLALGNAGRFVELEEAYLSTVEALANAVEAKDEYTGDHCRALAEMSLAVGGDFGMPTDRLKVLELGALFHDIGKIGVASDIIRKPGPLTSAERREMNLHPEIGSQILAPVPFLQPVRAIIHASHERWDGGGYPNGLSGEDIPLESRIIFVCDAFHAMTTDRPYRAALPQSEAVRRLRLSAGTQFDPKVVEVFVRLLGQGLIHFH
jgi:diguanylate cyclase (GGDEF)-like protein